MMGQYNQKKNKFQKSLILNIIGQEGMILKILLDLNHISLELQMLSIKDNGKKESAMEGEYRYGKMVPSIKEIG